MKRKVLFFLCLTALLCSQAIWAQETVQRVSLIGSESLNTTYIEPFSSNYTYSISEFIVPDYEMAGKQDLHSMSLYYRSSQDYTVNCTIYLKHTSYDDYLNASYYQPLTSQWSEVFSGSYTFTTGWNTINFASDFAYNGTQNLVVLIVDNSNQSVTGGTYFTGSSYTISNSWYMSSKKFLRFSGWSSMNPANSYSNMGNAGTMLTASRPLVKFQGTQPTYSLPYREGFEQDQTGVLNKPKDWQIGEGGLLSWTTVMNGWGTGGTGTLPNTGHNSTNALKGSYHDTRDTLNPIYTPFMTAPQGTDSIRLSFWFNNPGNASNYMSPSILGQRYVAATPNSPSNCSSEFFSNTRSDEYATLHTVHDGWTYVSAAQPMSYFNTTGPFRFCFSGETTGTTAIGMMFDDIAIEPIYGPSRVVELTSRNPNFLENFQNLRYPTDAGWYYGYSSMSSSVWSIAETNYSSTYSSKYLRLHYADNSSNNISWLTTHKFRIPNDAWSPDSVVIELRYRNPANGSHVDALEVCLEFDRENPGTYSPTYTAFYNSITTAHSDWTLFHVAIPVARLYSKEFRVALCGKPQNGGSFDINSLSVQYRKVYKYNMKVQPADGGVLQWTYLESHPRITDTTVYSDDIQLSYLDAYANEGYTFSHWVKTGRNLISDIVSSSPFVAVAAYTDEVTYTAVFLPIVHDTTTEREQGCPAFNGGAYANNCHYGDVAGYGTYRPGADIHYLAIPKPGHHFVKWANGSTANTLEVTDANHEFYTQAFFQPDTPVTMTVPYTVNFADSVYGCIPNGWGDVAAQYPFQSWPTDVFASPYEQYYNGTGLNTYNGSIFVLPYYAGNVSDLTVTVDCYSMLSSIEIGVMTDPLDTSTFEPLESIGTRYYYENFSVGLDSYTGNGHYIAFRTMLNEEEVFNLLGESGEPNLIYNNACFSRIAVDFSRDNSKSAAKPAKITKMENVTPKVMSRTR